MTHRPILAEYPPPFEDIPGVPGPLADWNDDRIFGEMLQRMNERMMRGDVPLNLTATSLITNAYLYTGDEQYRQWVLDYVTAWQERTRANSGIVPDNVGPTGKIGELMDGKWWGGFITLSLANKAVGRRPFLWGGLVTLGTIIGGIVLSTASTSIPFGKNLFSLPMPALWR